MFEILPTETRPFVTDKAFRQIMKHPRFAALLRRAEEARPDGDPEELYTLATDAVFVECMSVPAGGEDPELSEERERELDEIIRTIPGWESTVLADFHNFHDLEYLAWAVYVVHFVLVRLQRLLRLAAQLGAQEADDALIREVDPPADFTRVAEDFKYAVSARASAAEDFDTQDWAGEVLTLGDAELELVRTEFLEAMKQRATFLAVQRTLSIVVMDQTYGIGMGPEDEEHVFLVAWMDPYGHFASGSAETIDAEIDAARDLVACRLVAEGWRPGMSIEDAAQAHRRAEERANLAMLDEHDARDMWRAAPQLIARLPRRELAPLADLRRRYDVPAGSLMILPLDPAEAKVYDPEDRFAFAFRLPDGKGFMFTLGELADPEDLDDMRDPSRLWDWGGEGDWNSPALVLASGLDWMGVARILGLEPPSFNTTSPPKSPSP